MPSFQYHKKKTANTWTKAKPLSVEEQIEAEKLTQYRSAMYLFKGFGLVFGGKSNSLNVRRRNISELCNVAPWGTALRLNAEFAEAEDKIQFISGVLANLDKTALRLQAKTDTQLTVLEESFCGTVQWLHENKHLPDDKENGVFFTLRTTSVETVKAKVLTF